MGINIASSIFGSANPSGRFASKICGFLTLSDGIYAVTTLTFLESLSDAKVYSKTDDDSLIEIGEVSNGSHYVNILLARYLLGCFRLVDKIQIDETFDAAMATGEFKVGLNTDISFEADETISAFLSNSNATVQLHNSKVLNGFARMKAFDRNSTETDVGPMLLGSCCFQNEIFVGVVVAYNAEHREIYAAPLQDTVSSLREHGVSFASAEEVLEHNQVALQNYKGGVPVNSLNELLEAAKVSENGVSHAEQKVEALIRACFDSETGDWDLSVEQLAVEAEHLNLRVDFNRDVLILEPTASSTVLQLSQYIMMLGNSMEGAS